MINNGKYKIVYEFKRIERWREEFSTAQIIKLFNEVLNRKEQTKPYNDVGGNYPNKRSNSNNENNMKGDNK